MPGHGVKENLPFLNPLKQKHCQRRYILMDSECKMIYGNVCRSMSGYCLVHDPFTGRFLNKNITEWARTKQINKQLPAYNTKQYQNSFFVRTVEDWNHLEENIVKAGSASAFTSALSRSTPPAS